LSSCTQAEHGIPATEPQALPGIGSDVPAGTMIGETPIGGAMIGETTPGAAFAASGRWGRPETILLVEDEAFVRKVTAEVLESAGYRVVIATSAAEALEAYRSCSWPIDLVLADIVMPGISGRELATELKSLCPRARVLLMSGYAEQLARCESSPYKNCLAKPFSMRSLLSKVREVLDLPLVWQDALEPPSLSQ